ncbi:type II asparaginase [Trinickia mobilis]|uniref:type II asparaginase n=1 Tax=Trinickia mobilis TaxID=2816356 RepID=UPI001F5D95BE|nr:type II asparaginase [Trinickia mobilis]
MEIDTGEQSKMGANGVGVGAKRLPHIAILGTGGTIASTAASATQLHDYKLTGDIDAILNAVPQVRRIAELRAEQVVSVDSHDIDNAMLLTIARRVDAVLSQPDVEGVVLTHGTDTLEETAYFLNLTIKRSKPIVVVGAMRPSTALSADGPLNLYNAVRVATSAQAAGKGVLVVLNDRIGAARYVSKTSTTATDAFRSFEQGCIGEIAGGKIHFYNMPTGIHTQATEFPIQGVGDDLPLVDIIYDHQNAGTHLYDAAIRAGVRGIVLAATGNGSLSRTARAGARSALHHDVRFVRSTRVAQGVVTSLADDEMLHMVAANSLNPQKARILLMLALTRTSDFRAIQAYFDTY